MLAPAAWLKYKLLKERVFPPRAEILAEILRAVDPGKSARRGARAGAVGPGLISDILSPTPLRIDGRRAQVI
jgi:hypothetical protein